jgi:hypothetical protein
MVEPNPYPWSVTSVSLRRSKSCDEMRAGVKAKTRAPEHVLMDRVRHASSTRPLNTRSTYRPTKITPNFLVKFRHF